MNLLIYLIIIVYVAFVILLIERVVLGIQCRGDQKLLDIETVYEQLMSRKKKLLIEKKELEEETAKNFTLYELTKDITKHFNEEEAFHHFQTKLKENIQFSQCQLLEPMAKELKVLQSSREHSIFPLIGERSKVGYLVMKGIPESDKEKFFILAHQFALAMRRVKLNQEIEKLAITDSLTETYTRRYLMERLEEELRRSKMRGINLSILMVDVDYFKKVNDHYGHMTGDQMLKMIGLIIKENIREIDIVGRYGGEEFCVVLPDTGGPGAQYVAERIRLASAQKPIKAYDTSIQVTLSIGIATFPNDGKTIMELIDKADWALYRAKKLGRNRICAFGVYD